MSPPPSPAAPPLPLTPPIARYLSLVLIVGKFMRVMVTGAMYRIMYEELPNVDRILQLCLDIFLVREAGSN